MTELEPMRTLFCLVGRAAAAAALRFLGGILAMAVFGVFNLINEMTKWTPVEQDRRI